MPEVSNDIDIVRRNYLLVTGWGLKGKQGHKMLHIKAFMIAVLGIVRC